MTEPGLDVGQRRKRPSYSVLVPLLLALSACGGGGGGATTPPAPPVAMASSSISQGQAPLTVNFDASKSTDPQSFVLTYLWTFGDGTTATGATTSHVYQNHGSYTATVAVNDQHNTTTSTPMVIGVTPAPPTVQPTALPVNVLGVAATTASGTVSATDRENLTLTYSIATQPTVGTATINQSTGAITYTVAGYTSAATDSFTVNVANLGATGTGTVSVALNSDPLLPNQWHIQNTGQNAFSTTLPIAGNDMDVTGAWTAGYSGKGIKVGVVDSGLEAAHEDLAANVDLTQSWNFLTGTNDPTPTTSGFDHGTAVSGIIGAVAFNGKGGRGVAYNATLRGYNLLAPTAYSVANMAKAMGSDPISADNDLFNASFGGWGPNGANSLPQFSGAFQAITTTAMSLRAGLGSAIVNAAGNDFQDFESASSPYCAQFAQAFGVSCGNPASDERRGGDYPIIVGAINAAGVHSSYSSTGSSLWISAPGGEYGWDTTLTTNLTPFPYAAPFVSQAAIVTTNRDGCSNTNYSSVVNLLDNLGANPLAANCQYTATMNGTSAATPNVSGVVALMLEANPKLSVRDIKYILAKTAKHIDPAFAGVSSTTILAGSTIVLEQGWVANGAGYSFSNEYGFGAVNATAAVNAAKAYSTYLPAAQNSKNYTFLVAPPATITPLTTTGGFLTFAVSETFPTVEFVVVYINMDATPGLPCNQIELTSPSGTKSILLHAANGFTNSAIVNSRFESNAFYGESVNGTWTLRFLDLCGIAGSPTVLSTTQNQVLLIAGH
jgi:subtilisin family serine protease